MWHLKPTRSQGVSKTAFFRRVFGGSNLKELPLMQLAAADERILW